MRQIKWGKDIFYRGAASLPRTKPSYWSLDPRTAKSYARLRGGRVYKAVLTPHKIIQGSESDLAKHFRIARKWVAERVRGHSGAGLRRASELLYRTAEEKGYDVIVYSNQVVVLNPKIIHEINRR